MSVTDKVSTTLSSALNHLEKSISALSNRDDDLFAENVWHVVAELEYALFLFSIILQNDVTSKLKADPEPKKAEVSQMLADVSRFLMDAEKLVKNGKFLDAYGNVRNARNYVLRVQEEFSKRKREKPEKK